jgi:hypothetical protein
MVLDSRLENREETGDVHLLPKEVRSEIFYAQVFQLPTSDILNSTVEAEPRRVV